MYRSWKYTLFGWSKEFSSITLLEVRTVFDEPSELTDCCNPDTEIFRFTVSLPKLTICKKNHKTKNWAFYTSEMQIKRSERSMHYIQTSGLVWECFLQTQPLSRSEFQKIPKVLLWRHNGSKNLHERNIQVLLWWRFPTAIWSIRVEL